MATVGTSIQTKYFSVMQRRNIRKIDSTSVVLKSQFQEIKSLVNDKINKIKIFLYLG